MRKKDLNSQIGGEKKGHSFMCVDLMVDEENLVEAGSFKLQINSDGCSVEKEFEVKKYGIE